MRDSRRGRRTSPASTSRSPPVASWGSWGSCVGPEVTREELVDHGRVLVSSRVVAVALVRIDALVRGADPVEQRVAGFWRTHVVLESDVHDDRTPDAVGEIDAVE